MSRPQKLGGRTAKTPPSRLVMVDDTRRTPVIEGKPVRPMFLKVEPMAALPIIAIDGSGNPIARFANTRVAAYYLNAEPVRPLTLPAPVIDFLSQLF